MHKSLEESDTKNYISQRRPQWLLTFHTYSTYIQFELKIVKYYNMIHICVVQLLLIFA